MFGFGHLRGDFNPDLRAKIDKKQAKLIIYMN